MSTRVIKQTRHPLETLERMLQKTTLHTQRLTHQNIMDIGDKLLTVTESDDREDKQKAIDDAVSDAEARATRELRASLQRLGQDKDEERQRALDKQKWYNDRQGQRISDQRDRAEEERLKDLKRRLALEKEQALAAQREDSLRLQQEAVAAACSALRQQLRQEFETEKKQAVTEALRDAREAFKKREEEIRTKTREQCEQEARREAERTAKLHQAAMDCLTQKYKVLNAKYNKELNHKDRVEKDFRELQEDYRRFMDLTDGQFHSDYLMKLRHLGLALSEKRVSVVNYDDIPQLPAL